METFGNRIKRFRISKQLSPKQVSERTGIPLSTYREWEAGRQIKGQPYVLLSEVFEVSLHELLTGEAPHSQECFVLLDAITKDLHQLRKSLRSLS